ncbi:MAG TPA: lysophospholipid acyltransferase family protein [Candidatus Angelobacter sp.]|nr:lysophospholipid acyltransferase family protein [Candidatus Angelobacter sp.]
MAQGGVLSRLRSYFIFVPLIYLYTAVMGSLSLLSSFIDRGGRMQHWFAVHWARMILATVFVRVHVEGADHIDPSQPAVYTSNHLSALDTPVLYSCIPGQFRIMAKRELFSYPFMGWHLTRSGQIPIDQGDARASLRSLNRASESLRHGMPLAIFPEGGRAPDGHLQPFMGGAFYMAIKAQAPVVPIVLVGTYELLPMNSFCLRPGRVQMIIGEPIPTKGMKPRQMDELSAHVRQAMADTYYSRSNLSECHPERGRVEQNASESKDPLDRDDSLVR